MTNHWQLKKPNGKIKVVTPKDACSLRIAYEAGYRQVDKGGGFIQISLALREAVQSERPELWSQETQEAWKRIYVGMDKHLKPKE
jgi:hypothetical protein